MKFILFIILFCLVNRSFSQTKIEDTVLVKLIDSLYKADQATAQIKPGDSAAAAFQRVVRTNFPLVSQIFEQYGFPNYQLVGKKTSDQYFLLVQHSDMDVQFQKKVLAKMEKEVMDGNASGKNFAFLTDRININEGKPQVYGTQVHMSGHTIIKNCIDVENLDKRRKAVGLEPIKEYLDRCNEVFYELNPGQKKPGRK